MSYIFQLVLESKIFFKSTFLITRMFILNFSILFSFPSIAFFLNKWRLYLHVIVFSSFLIVLHERRQLLAS